MIIIGPGALFLLFLLFFKPARTFLFWCFVLVLVAGFFSEFKEQNASVHGASSIVER